jgi:DNA-binding transcriptional MerR regulator
MAEATADVLAIPDKRAASLARVSMRRLRYWEQVRLVTPSIRRELSRRNTVRLYTFQDLLELLVVAELRHRPGISLQHIQRLVGHLHQQGYAAPLRELRFATRGGDIYVQHPDGSWSGDPLPDQVIFHQVITLEPLRAKIEGIGRRDPRAAGKVVHRRGVHASKPIFAGTRITVAAVQRYLRAGYDEAAILEEYPSLTAADIDAARHHPAA